MSPWRRFGQQLALPSGWGGWLTGTLMRVVNRQPNDLAIAALALNDDDDVLELGFGPGDAIARIVPKVPRGSVSGIDLSHAMYRQASRRNKRAIRKGRVHLERGDFHDLPFHDDSFDKILAINTAYFWRDRPGILEEILRVLRPSGRIVLYVTDTETMQKWKFASPQTHHHFDARSLADMLAAGGFPSDSISVFAYKLAAGTLGLVATAQLAGDIRAPGDDQCRQEPEKPAKAAKIMKSAVTTLVAMTAATSSFAADLKVDLHGAVPGGGPVRLDLFAQAEGFRHEDQAIRREAIDASGSTVEFVLKGLPPGRYAIMAYQDANRNGRLDLRFGMFPKEAWGLSNDPKMLGPPRFAACAFDVRDQPNAIEIPLHH